MLLNYALIKDILRYRVNNNDKLSVYKRTGPEECGVAMESPALKTHTSLLLNTLTFWMYSILDESGSVHSFEGSSLLSCMLV